MFADMHDNLSSGFPVCRKDLDFDELVFAQRTLDFIGDTLRQALLGDGHDR